MANYKNLDSWALRAQKEGYPARSVFKLQEINEKFHLFSGKNRRAGGFRALDLGAAPGSWSLFALRTLKTDCFLAACDLSPLSRDFDKGLFDGDNVFFLQGDMENEENKARLLEKGPFDLVMCDAAPATTGNRSIDTARSLSLTETSLSYAEAALARGGNYVAKIFQGAETADFLKTIKPAFAKTQTFKPAACRPNSFELYIVALGKL